MDIVVTIDPLRERNCKHAPFVATLLNLTESGSLNQLVHLPLDPTPHDPRLSFSVARESACDQLDLRMPRLTRIDEIAAGGRSRGHASERATYQRVIRKQLIETGDD